MPIDCADDRRCDFERHVVVQILKRAREPILPTTGESINLTWFRERYPRFPIRLGAGLLSGREPFPWEDFFKRFTKTPCFLAYQQWRSAENLDDSRERVGVVFNCHCTLVVLHNWNGPRKVETCRLVRAIGTPRVRFAIEPLEWLLAAIGADWAKEALKEITLRSEI